MRIKEHVKRKWEIKKTIAKFLVSNQSTKNKQQRK
jgi:hypothetical protein